MIHLGLRRPGWAFSSASQRMVTVWGLPWWSGTVAMRAVVVGDGGDEGHGGMELGLEGVVGFGEGDLALAGEVAVPAVFAAAAALGGEGDAAVVRVATVGGVWDHDGGAPSGADSYLDFT